MRVQYMKKINMCVMLGLYIFLPLNGMEAGLRDPAGGQYSHPQFRFVPLHGMDMWWSDRNGGQYPQFYFVPQDTQKIIYLCAPDVTIYPVLRYYIDRFGYAKENSPVKIASQESLNCLSQYTVEDFLQKIKAARKPQELCIDNEKADIIETIFSQLPIEVDRKIAKIIQELHEDGNLSSLFSHVLFHRMCLKNNYRVKNFFNNKKFYWQSIDDNFCNIVFYNQDNKRISVKLKNVVFLSNGKPFMLAYDSNTILISTGEEIIIHNLETEEVRYLDGNFCKYAISPNGQYIAFCSCSEINTIQVYDITDLDSMKSVANLDYINMDEFVFSPDGSKLIVWAKGVGEVIMWDLTDINKPTSKSLATMHCINVIFNSDNKHVCILNARHTSGIVLNINNPEQMKEMPVWNQVNIFPEHSDVILYQYCTKQGKQVKLFAKTGQLLEFPQRLYVDNVYNGDANEQYVLTQHVNNTVYLFDHSPDLMASWYSSQCLTLERGIDNAITGERFGEKGQQVTPYWQLPEKEEIQQLQAINNNLTTGQYAFLQAVRFYKRERKEPLMIKDEFLSKTFTMFEPCDRSFLKKQLFLTEQ